MIYSLATDGDHLRTMRHNIDMWRTPPDIITQQSVTLNGSVHMEANPLIMLSFYVGLTQYSYSYILSSKFLSLLYYGHSAGNLAHAKHPSGPGKFFHARWLSAPAVLSAHMPLSALGLPPLRESPDPSSRTPGLAQLVFHGFPWLHPNAPWSSYPERAGIPMLNGSCHSSLGSSDQQYFFTAALYTQCIRTN